MRLRVLDTVFLLQRVPSCPVRAQFRPATGFAALEGHLRVVLAAGAARLEVVQGVVQAGVGAAQVRLAHMAGTGVAVPFHQRAPDAGGGLVVHGELLVVGAAVCADRPATGNRAQRLHHVRLAGVDLLHRLGLEGRPVAVVVVAFLHDGVVGLPLVAFRPFGAGFPFGFGDALRQGLRERPRGAAQGLVGLSERLGAFPHGHFEALGAVDHGAERLVHAHALAHRGVEVMHRLRRASAGAEDTGKPRRRAAQDVAEGEELLGAFRQRLQEIFLEDPAAAGQVVPVRTRKRTGKRIANAVERLAGGIAQAGSGEELAAHRSSRPASACGHPRRRLAAGTRCPQRNAEQRLEHRLRLGIRVRRAEAQRSRAAHRTSRFDGRRFHGEQRIVQALVHGLEHHVHHDGGEAGELGRHVRLAQREHQRVAERGVRVAGPFADAHGDAAGGVAFG